MSNPFSYAGKRVVVTGAATGVGAALLDLLAERCQVAPSSIYVKRRFRQRGATQYERVDHSGHETLCPEGPCRLRVNLRDYVDTGLFLDHRILRAMIGDEARGRRAGAPVRRGRQADDSRPHPLPAHVRLHAAAVRGRRVPKGTEPTPVQG